MVRYHCNTVLLMLVQYATVFLYLTGVGELGNSALMEKTLTTATEVLYNCSGMVIHALA